MNRKVSVLPYNILKNELINSLPMKTLKNWPQKLLVIGPNLFFTVQLSPQPRLDFLYYRLVPSLICLLICAISPSQCNPISLTFHEKKNIFGRKTFRISFFYRSFYIRVMHNFFNQTKMQRLILHSLPFLIARNFS